jgi:hypothetical protein
VPSAGTYAVRGSDNQNKNPALGGGIEGRGQPIKNQSALTGNARLVENPITALTRDNPQSRDRIGNLRPFPFRGIAHSLGTNCPRSIRSQSDGFDLPPHSTERRSKLCRSGFMRGSTAPLDPTELCGVVLLPLWPALPQSID